MPAPMTVPYPKTWLAIEGQLQKLRDGGLIIADEPAAADFLRHLNYLRVGSS